MFDEMLPRDRLVTMTFTVEELAYISGAVAVLGGRNELISRINAVTFDTDAR